MDIFDKARILADAGRFDSCGPAYCEVTVAPGLGGVQSVRARNKDCKIFKTLMDNNCSFDCAYCVNSNRCAKQKAKYEPEELANLFNALHRKHGVQGLFLSSAVAGEPDTAAQRMIDAVRLLRTRHGFKGYIHLKALPGMSHDLIKQAAELADRMSINIEAPTQSVLSGLSSCKTLKSDIIRRQRWVSKLPLKSGQTTQMIVGSFASDEESLRTAWKEYTRIGLRRVYYSAFVPARGTALQDAPAEDPLRERRLYNTDFLFREYGYTLKDVLGIMHDGMLPRGDPKLALARQRFGHPVDVNGTGYDDLVRVPGIGPATARKIVAAAETCRLRSASQLSALGVRMRAAAPFLAIDGKRQAMLGEFA